MKIFLIVLTSILIFDVDSFAQNIPALVASNVQYVANDQKHADDFIYEVGEWPTHIYSTPMTVAFGIGKMITYNQEATAFTTASVMIQLATLYLENPEYQNEFRAIPQLLEKAVPSLLRYRDKDLYNFYPPQMKNGVMVRQPTDMRLIQLWRGLANIPPDADTSSTVFSALSYNAILHGQKFQMSEDSLTEFAKFRDINRRPHFYNRKQHQINTGAFLTWLLDENDRQMPRAIFAPVEAGERIPFRINDIDCVVNLNVLRMLNLQKATKLEGHDEACAFINDVVKKNQMASCGIYYPNTFNLGFSAAQVQAIGETCLQESRKSELVEKILKMQSEDGAWDNDRNFWNDRIQSTAFAMITLFEFGDLKDQRIEASLRFATIYLLGQVRRSPEGFFYWPEEVFFTATALVRSLIVWKSNSYTTLIAAEALMKMHRYYPEFEPRLSDYNSRL